MASVLKVNALGKVELLGRNVTNTCPADWTCTGGQVKLNGHVIALARETQRFSFSGGAQLLGPGSLTKGILELNDASVAPFEGLTVGEISATSLSSSVILDFMPSYVASLAVERLAHLSGDLIFRTDPGFVAPSGNNVTLVSFASRSGDFVRAVGCGGLLTIDVTPTAFIAAFVGSGALDLNTVYVDPDFSDASCCGSIK